MNNKHKVSIISENGKTTYSSMSNLMVQKDHKVLLLTILSSIYVLAGIVMSLISSFSNTEPIILTFTKDSENSVFGCNIIMFYVIFIIIGGII